MINADTYRSWTVYSAVKREHDAAVVATSWTCDGPIDSSASVVGTAPTVAEAEREAKERQRCYDQLRSNALQACREVQVAS